MVRVIRELLCIDTTNPPGREEPAAELLEAHLAKAGLNCEILSSPEGRPNLVVRLPGPPDRPALILLRTPMSSASRARNGRTILSAETSRMERYGDAAHST